MTTKTKFTVLRQEALIGINLINTIKHDNMYVVLDEYNGYSTICQYSSKYDNFHIITVQTDRLNPKMKLSSADTQN